jgi:hypothetical protein
MCAIPTLTRGATFNHPLKRVIVPGHLPIVGWRLWRATFGGEAGFVNDNHKYNRRSFDFRPPRADFAQDDSSLFQGRTWRRLLIDGAGEEAAVDDDDFAGNEGRGLRGEEDGGSGELVSLAEAMHGRADQ